MSENSNKRLQGIGGWLIVLLIIYIINILISASRLIEIIGFYQDGVMELINDPTSMYYIANMNALIIFEVIIFLVFITYLLFLIYTMFGKKESFIKFAIYFYVISVSLSALDLLFTNIVVPGSVDTTMIGQFVGSIFHAFIWITYLRRSERVENTFIN